MTGGASNRQRGDYFERQTRDALTAVGWVVVRAAGSHGPADLVALRDGNTPLLLSCKVSGRIDPGERADLLTTATVAGARPIVAERPTRGLVRLTQLDRDAADGRRLDVAELRVPKRRRPEHDDDQDDDDQDEGDNGAADEQPRD